MSRKSIIESNFTPLSGVAELGTDLVFSVEDKESYVLDQTFELEGESYTINQLTTYTATEGRETEYYLFILK